MAPKSPKQTKQSPKAAANKQSPKVTPKAAVAKPAVEKPSAVAKTVGRVQKSIRKVKASQKGTKLRASITPGTVLILLGGRFRGRRVVFLKQLERGLLLVTGPYAVNGVPLRRVNQRFAIATSSKVQIDKADATKITDKYFSQDKKKKAKKSEAGFFAAGAEKTTGASEEKKAGQKKLDAGIVSALSPDMKLYLKARFSLSSGQFPHEMKF